MFENKKILVIGGAKSGVSAAEFLLRNGAKVVLTDSKSKEDLSKVISSLDKYENIEFLVGRNPSIDEISDIDFAVISPGVPLEIDYIIELKKLGKEVISEIELSYRCSISKSMDFIGITGTNGKTTTTSIIGEIFKSANYTAHVVGNIGTPSISAVETGADKSVLVTELSSFQLESIVDFRPRVCCVLNLTEDHLNRHKTIENYAAAKARIFENQKSNDYCIFNYDDEITREMSKSCTSNIVFFSRNIELENGVYVDKDSNIVYKNEDEVSIIMKSSELSLPGMHNLENAMAAVGVCMSYGIDKDIISTVLKTFKAVEHRLEYVDTINGVKFVNDSKGTNPDSTIKAVQSYSEPVILIAGGYDKGSDFNELFEIAKKNVRTVVSLGQTSNQIMQTAKAHGIKEIYEVDSIKSAVNKSAEIANENDVVLLSPACASWGMYNNYEERGNDFKNCVTARKDRI